MFAKNIVSIICIFCFSSIYAQINTNGASLYIKTGTSISLSGNLSSNSNITGGGKILMNGQNEQLLDCRGNQINNIEISNPSHVKLISGIKITKSLSFLNGKIITGDNNVIFSDSTSTTGAGYGRFIETTGTGSVIKEIATNTTEYKIPVGNNNIYRPAFITSNGIYSNASVSIKSVASLNPNKPVSIANYLTHYWNLKKSGINGTLFITGQYNDSSDITGNESTFTGYYYNGIDWSSSGGTSDVNTNTIGTPVSSDSGALYAMNKFILLGSRAFLQGAYNSVAGLMSDGLRSPVLYLPSSDPYRTINYSTAFSHINNPITETISGNPFNSHQSVNDDITDWVFLELRNTNTSPGNTVLATRSALIQRDGDIVDMDGISPVTFNNVPNGNYAVTIRHRNHLPISLNPTNSAAILNESKSTAFSSNVIDLRIANANQLFGSTTGYTTSTHPVLTNVNLMWGGNANGNTNSRYSGASNDRAAILLDLGSNEINTILGYYKSDLNMNGNVKYSGAANDRAFLLGSVLGNSEITVRNGQIPN